MFKIYLGTYLFDDVQIHLSVVERQFVNNFYARSTCRAGGTRGAPDGGSGWAEVVIKSGVQQQTAADERPHRKY